MELYKWVKREIVDIIVLGVIGIVPMKSSVEKDIVNIYVKTIKARRQQMIIS
jgi:hypothetical protein